MGINPRIRYSPDGTKTYYKKNKRHRVGGPAVEGPEGTMWFLHGIKHRLDGPAEISVSGLEYWFIDGRLHREDGPAIASLAKNIAVFCLNGERYDDVNEWLEALDVSAAEKVLLKMQWG